MGRALVPHGESRQILENRPNAPLNGSRDPSAGSRNAGVGAPAASSVFAGRRAPSWPRLGLQMPPRGPFPSCALASPGATRDIGSALTRMCMRHRSIETKLRQFTK